ncbi:hypothetical protein FPRO06_04052 [Fusarium proliferatum]|nr:hypothetical protein FPRO04_02139 [Fusarium proliferatum]KAG4289230.1 hypothetical protein FPRO06_04052 [Fusarium proliferatum]
MGKKSIQAAAPKNDAASTPPPGQLMDLVENFLSDHSFKGAADAFKKQREKKGWKATAATDEEGNPSLVSVYQTWEATKGDDSSKSSKSSKKKSSKKDSSSSASSDSSSDSSDAKEEDDSSDSSVTLDKTSPEFQSNSAYPPLPPDPVVNGNGRKKQNEPFSRIPKNIKVDAKFASNEYVSIAYSQKAHEDLIVTKGKGFTKEKNKKKRGSYRGGAIDIHDKKGIYFDD